MWKTHAHSTARGQHHGRMWISTHLLQPNKQVLHRQMAKKDINLLNLQIVTRLLTNGVYA